MVRLGLEKVVGIIFVEPFLDAKMTCVIYIITLGIVVAWLAIAHDSLKLIQRIKLKP